MNLGVWLSWRDAYSKQSCELFVAKAGSACPRPEEQCNCYTNQQKQLQDNEKIIILLGGVAQLVEQCVRNA